MKSMQVDPKPWTEFRLRSPFNVGSIVLFQIMLNIKYSYPDRSTNYQYTMYCISMHAWLWWYWVLWLITETITQNCRSVLLNTYMHQFLGSKNLNFFFFKYWNIPIPYIAASYCWMRIIIKTKREKKPPIFVLQSGFSH